MAFPRTSDTLLERIARGGSETDWRRFFGDYWGPLCRFAARYGLGTDDAEDIAAQTFEVLAKSDLLTRFAGSRSARLRSLLCAVAGRVLSSRAKVSRSRTELHRRYGGSSFEVSVAPEQLELFYSSWADAVVVEAVESLTRACGSEGRSDLVRVLYERVHAGRSSAEIARSMGVPLHEAENRYKQVRRRLAAELRRACRERAIRYANGADVERQVEEEWDRLGAHLGEHGGLEEALRRVHEGVFAPGTAEPGSPRREESLATLLSGLTP